MSARSILEICSVALLILAAEVSWPELLHHQNQFLLGLLCPAIRHRIVT
jgi:hypothetical protein